MTNIDWNRVQSGLARERHKMIWRPYGLPEVGDPTHSSFHDTPISQAWDIPGKLIVSTAITGAFMTKRLNPNQPITTDEILAEARACAAAGASTVHIHVRDDDGFNTLDVDRFRGRDRAAEGGVPGPRG